MLDLISKYSSYYESEETQEEVAKELEEIEKQRQKYFLDFKKKINIFYKDFLSFKKKEIGIFPIYSKLNEEYRNLKKTENTEYIGTEKASISSHLNALGEPRNIVFYNPIM